MGTSLRDQIPQHAYYFIIRIKMLRGPIIVTAGDEFRLAGGREFLPVAAQPVPDQEDDVGQGAPVHGGGSGLVGRLGVLFKLGLLFSG